MPSVAVLPPPPAPGFGPSILSTYFYHLLPLFASNDSFDFSLPTEMQNGYSPVHRETVADIKTAAKEQVQRVRGASATSLLRTAREQVLLAKVNENDGDLRGALSAYTKAASLAAMFMDTIEFKQEMQPGKKGVLTQDFLKFKQVRLHLLCSARYGLTA